MASPDEAIDILESIPGNRFRLRELVKQIESRMGVVPFVGAGLSILFGYPGWLGFLLSRGREAGVEDQIRELTDAGQFEEAAEALAEAMGPTAFEDAIRESFGDHVLEGREIDDAVSVLPLLAMGPVITTNFDHVLERAFERAGRPFELVVWGAKVDPAMEALRRDRRFLLKLHGDVRDRTERILTRGQYGRHYGDLDPSGVDLSLPLPNLLRVMMEGRTLLFVGCSLGRDRTVAVLHRVAEELPGAEHYALVERPDDEEGCRSKAKHLSEHGIRPIWYPAGRHDLIEPVLRWLSERRPAGPTPAARTHRPGQLSGPEDPRLAHRHGFVGDARVARRPRAPCGRSCG